MNGTYSIRTTDLAYGLASYDLEVDWLTWQIFISAPEKTHIAIPIKKDKLQHSN